MTRGFCCGNGNIRKLAVHVIDEDEVEHFEVLSIRVFCFGFLFTIGEYKQRVCQRKIKLKVFTSGCGSMSYDDGLFSGRIANN